MPPLESLIRNKINEEGSISTERFMSLILSHPIYGYYNLRDSIGVNGDFITAPELSQMFGELIGLWAVVVWEQTNINKKLSITEIGPGTGMLMSDALRAIKQVNKLEKDISINLVEISQKLKAYQKEKLFGYNTRWYQDISNLPSETNITFANEFFDALPIIQLISNKNRWFERRIAISDTPPHELIFVHGSAIKPNTLPSNILNLKAGDGEIFEYSPARENAVLSLAKRIEKNGGAILIIDYGHSRTSIGETLQGIKNHQIHSVLEKPGTADITAHVDFDALKRAVSSTKTKFFGPITQGEFLRRIGIETRAAALLKKATNTSAIKIESSLNRLINPIGMGEIFKVVAITKEDAPVPPGF